MLRAVSYFLVAVGKTDVMKSDKDLSFDQTCIDAF